MNIWANTVLTEKGTALLAKLMAGHTLSIRRAGSSSGFVTPGLLVKQTDLTNLRQELTFRSVAFPEEGKCTVSVVLKNDGLSTGYTATQIGLYAYEPDEDRDVLFIISQAPDAQSGTTIPSNGEMPGYSAEWNFTFAYGQASSVHVTVDPSNTVTRNDMEAYVANEVTKGLNMQGVIDMGGHKLTNLPNPEKSGDAATKGFVENFTIQGNTYVATDDNNDGNVVLRPYVADVDETVVREHIASRANPHGVTPGQIGAVSTPAVVADMDTMSEIFGLVSGDATKNHPSGSHGFAINRKIGDYQMQYIFYLAEPGKIVSRARVSGTWGKWSEITFTMKQ